MGWLLTQLWSLHPWVGREEILSHSGGSIKKTTEVKEKAAAGPGKVNLTRIAGLEQGPLSGPVLDTAVLLWGVPPPYLRGLDFTSGTTLTTNSVESSTSVENIYQHQLEAHQTRVRPKWLPPPLHLSPFPILRLRSVIERHLRIGLHPPFSKVLVPEEQRKSSLNPHPSQHSHYNLADSGGAGCFKTDTMLELETGL